MLATAPVLLADKMTPSVIDAVARVAPRLKEKLRPALTEGAVWWTELSLQGTDQATGEWLMQGYQASPYRSSFVGSAASV